MKVHIPASLDEALETLRGIGRLLTAKQWERAAIVWALTHPPQEAGRPSKQSEMGGNPLISIRGLAEKGIVGLRHPEQVREYRKAWQGAIDDGQASADVPLGQDIELPTLPWKDYYGEPTKEVQQRVFTQVLREVPDAIEKATKGDPAFAGVVADRVLATPVVGQSVRNRVAAEAATTLVRLAGVPKPLRKRDWHADLIEATNLIYGLVKAREDEEWEPTALEEMLFRALGTLINQQHGKVDPDVFDDIDDYLRKAKVK